MAEYKLDGDDQTPEEENARRELVQEQLTRDMATRLANAPEQFARFINEHQAREIIKAIITRYPHTINIINATGDTLTTDE